VAQHCARTGDAEGLAQTERNERAAKASSQRRFMRDPRRAIGAPLLAQRRVKADVLPWPWPGDSATSAACAAMPLLNTGRALPLVSVDSARYPRRKIAPVRCHRGRSLVAHSPSAPSGAAATPSRSSLRRVLQCVGEKIMSTCRIVARPTPNALGRQDLDVVAGGRRCFPSRRGPGRRDPSATGDGEETASRRNVKQCRQEPLETVVCVRSRASARGPAMRLRGQSPVGSSRGPDNRREFSYRAGHIEDVFPQSRWRCPVM